MTDTAPSGELRVLTATTDINPASLRQGGILNFDRGPNDGPWTVRVLLIDRVTGAPGSWIASDIERPHEAPYIVRVFTPEQALHFECAAKARAQGAKQCEVTSTRYGREIAARGTAADIDAREAAERAAFDLAVTVRAAVNRPGEQAADARLRVMPNLQKLLTDIEAARAVLAYGSRRDVKTGQLLSSVAALIAHDIEEGRPLGMLPFRAAKLAEAVLAEHGATEEV